MLSTIHIFASLTEEQLLSVADRLDTHLYQKNEVIFNKGEPANGLYIIASGRVQILKPQAARIQELSIFDRSDFFGEEGMVIGQRRKVTAVAASNLILYHLKSEQIEALTEEYPEIISPIRLAINSYQIIQKKNFKWRSPRESIQFVAREHIFFLALKILLPIIFSIVTLSFTASLFFAITKREPYAEVLFIINLVGVLGWFVWLIIDWANDYSIITNRRAVTLEKVALLYEKRREAPLDAILSVETKTGQWGRWFGFGNVIIRTFTGIMTFKNLAHPELVVHLIDEARSRSRVTSKKSQRHQKEDAIRQRLGLEQRRLDPFDDAAPQDELLPSEHVQPGLLSAWLALIFRLRTEENGIITYRTHWYFLLKRIFLPSLILLLLCMFLFFKLVGILTFLSLSQMLLFFSLASAIVLIWWFYQFIDWRNDRYVITHDQIIDIYKKPLGEEQKRSAPIKNIQTVEFERLGLISIILNYGTVNIRVGDTSFSFDYVYNPSAAQSEIFERYQQFTTQQAQRQKTELQQEMADWIEIYHQVVQNGGTPPPPPSITGFSGYNNEE